MRGQRRERRDGRTGNAGARARNGCGGARGRSASGMVVARGTSVHQRGGVARATTSSPGRLCRVEPAAWAAPLHGRGDAGEGTSGAGHNGAGGQRVKLAVQSTTTWATWPHGQVALSRSRRQTGCRRCGRPWARPWRWQAAKVQRRPMHAHERERRMQGSIPMDRNTCTDLMVSPIVLENSVHRRHRNGPTQKLRKV